MHRSTFVAIVAMIVGVSLNLAPVARSAPTAANDAAKRTAESKQHFQQAELHYQRGEFELALKEYTLALTAKSHPAFLFNIAQCHRNLSRYGKALFYYRLYLSKVPNAPNRVEVERRIAEMHKKEAAARDAAVPRGRLSVVSTPPGAKVFLDSQKARPAGSTPGVFTLKAGEHVVEVRIPGYATVHRTVTIEKDRVQELRVQLERPGAATPPARRPGAGVTPPPRDTAPPVVKRWWLWTGLGVAVAMLATAAYTGSEALRMQKDWDKYEGNVPNEDPDDFKSKRKTFAITTDVLIGVGAALVVSTTIAAIVAHRRRNRERAAQLRILPTCGARGCGLAITGRF